MVSTAPDAEKMRDARAGLAQEIDRQITYALHMLGESGVEATGPWKYRLWHKGEREDTIGEVCSDFSDQMKRWQQLGYAERDGVLFFEYMRKRCYDLYEKTNAWDTISALARAVSAAITLQLENESGDGDRVILRAIIQFLGLLDVDIAIYQAVNRGNNHGAIKNCWVAQGKARELLEFLDSGGSGDRSVELGDGRAELRKELLAEAYALHEVYRGIHYAAVALACHEKAIRNYYNDHSGSDYVAGDPPVHAAGGVGSARASEAADGSRPWPDPLVIGNLDDARGEVGIIIRRLEEDQGNGARELSPAASERAMDIVSRLNPWASLLRSVAAAYGQSKPMRLPTVQIRYCFPFAVKADEERLGELSPELRKRAPGVEVEGGRRAVPKLAGVLDAWLKCLDKGTATVKALELTDFWAGAGEGMYGGNTVSLPGLSDKHHADEEWNAWVDQPAGEPLPVH